MNGLYMTMVMIGVRLLLCQYKLLLIFHVEFLDANGSRSAGNKTGMALVVSDSGHLQRHLLHLVPDPL